MTFQRVYAEGIFMTDNKFSLCMVATVIHCCVLVGSAEANVIGRE